MKRNLTKTYKNSNTQRAPQTAWAPMPCIDCIGVLTPLVDHNLNHNISDKLNIMKLLAGLNYNQYHKNYPAENILENFECIDNWIDELICEIAELADTKFLKNIFDLLSLENISFKFHLSHNSRHDAVLTWLNQNISKGRTNGASLLGWQSGPCCQRWPSVNLIDYENTLSMLTPYVI
ncbi:hypothetical protein FQR65_LT14446 [Abscondita terminalis]|nr:hypothetical protein FQR65_LT14446 [Abscondita terminalis]